MNTPTNSQHSVQQSVTRQGEVVANPERCRIVTVFWIQTPVLQSLHCHQVWKRRPPIILDHHEMDPKAYHQVSSMCGLLEEPKNTRLEHKYGRDL